MMRSDDFLGRVVAGRFRITRFLGEGGMATVYVAEQDDEPHEVALKIMNRELTADRSFVRRFQREAKAASRVQHPNSVRIIDYGVADGLSYMAMELLVGDDLYVLLERYGPIAQARAARILAEVCDALSVAHELGIVHRDLKPENVMVVPDLSHSEGERVKVLDFGIAKLLDLSALRDDDEQGRDPRLDPHSAVTRAGMFIGTPAYMSPEQCSLLTLDTRSDIYTCGVLLFQLVTGRMPFEGETPLHTATLHIHQAPPAPSAYAPLIDPRLETIILKALSKRPADRQQSARHLGTMLRRLYPDLPDTPAASGPISRRTGGSQRPLAPPASSSRRIDVSPPEERIESAKTMVAEGLLLGPPPSLVLNTNPRDVRPSAPPPETEGPLSDRGVDSDGPRAMIQMVSMDGARPSFSRFPAQRTDGNEHGTPYPGTASLGVPAATSTQPSPPSPQSVRIVVGPHGGSRHALGHAETLRTVDPSLFEPVPAAVTLRPGAAPPQQDRTALTMPPARAPAAPPIGTHGSTAIPMQAAPALVGPPQPVGPLVKAGMSGVRGAVIGFLVGMLLMAICVTVFVFTR